MEHTDAIHHFGGEGTVVKEAVISAGACIVKHRHSYDHLSYLVSGTARLLRAEGAELLHGPCMVHIRANEHHGVEAVTDVRWLCIHNGEPQVEKPDFSAARALSVGSHAG